MTPHPELRPFVEALWLQENKAFHHETPPTRVVPTCGVELVFCYGAPFEHVDASRTISMPMALVSGQRMRAISVRATGTTGMVIVRCYPWAARSLFGTATASDLVDTYAPLDELHPVLPTRQLYDGVVTAHSPEQRLERVSNYLRRVFSTVHLDPSVLEAIDRLNASWGRLDIATLAGELSLSRRQLHRRFAGATGVGAKRFARLIRFQKALGCLRAGLPWSEIVGRCGYVDQAHWIAEANAFMGEPPGRLSNRAATPLMVHFNEQTSRALNTTTYL